MNITVGRIVLYALSEEDAIQINRRRTSGSSIAERIKNNSKTLNEQMPGSLAPHWPIGAQAHIGNAVNSGDVYPLIVTRVHESCGVNGQVLLDGNDQFWVNSVQEGGTNGTWSWPPRV